MRADIQRKPLGFQEVTASHYRCESICVTRLLRSQQTPSHSLVLKTTEFLEQPSNAPLFQSVFKSSSWQFFCMERHQCIYILNRLSIDIPFKKTENHLIFSKVHECKTMLLNRLNFFFEV